jgi:hypothetical protein
MFCDRCGSELQPAQKFCSGCGRPVGVALVQRASDGRVARNISVLAILWLVASALNLLGGLGLFMVSRVIFGRLVRFEPDFQGFLHGLLGWLGAFLLFKAVAGFAAGWGLIQRESWARPLALVLGFISLVHIPLGTALGVYTIWVLMPQQSEEEYAALPRAA